jgi:hypothetical protein
MLQAPHTSQFDVFGGNQFWESRVLILFKD